MRNEALARRHVGVHLMCLALKVSEAGSVAGSIVLWWLVHRPASRYLAGGFLLQSRPLDSESERRSRRVAAALLSADSESPEAIQFPRRLTYLWRQSAARSNSRQPSRCERSVLSRRCFFPSFSPSTDLTMSYPVLPTLGLLGGHVGVHYVCLALTIDSLKEYRWSIILCSLRS